ncbi:MAG: alanine:cation symporter family protein [Planctomycetota bacterium]|nr:alanine:cation symporter family protein [Planctomycetota bacterium]
MSIFMMNVRTAFLFAVSALVVAAVCLGPAGLTQAQEPASPLAPPEQSQADAADEPAEEETAESDSVSARIQKKIDAWFGKVTLNYLVPMLFVGVPTGFDKNIPLILLVLVLGGIFFTFRFGFVNIRMFRHSIAVIRGKFDRPEDEGEITHFQALTSALSATVGLGNIASVAVAVATGGPGAIFWMWMIAFFGMSSKFSSCSFGQLYRRVKPDGTVLGGPMVYLDDGIREHYPRLAPLGKIFGYSFAFFTVMGTMGAGNMFQGNQTFKMFARQFDLPNSYALPVGILLAVLVGMVIIGGIRRIGEVTSKLVPIMCGFYCVVCLIIIFTNVDKVPAMFASIFGGAFSLESAFGGFIGSLIIGARRAAFSNEAGLGSAAIAHAAARTEEPVREGIVAMVGPFIDTILVCTMTALAILITQSHLDSETGKPYAADVADTRGVEITAAAFESLGTLLPYFLCIAVFIFAYSTMISWSYYGERAVEYMLGMRAVVPYRFVYVLAVVVGPLITKLDNLLLFCDIMLLCMAFPNIIGMVMLSHVLKKREQDYIGRLKSGQMKPVN